MSFYGHKKLIWVFNQHKRLPMINAAKNEMKANQNYFY
jgi:hypothetical protein